MGGIETAVGVGVSAANLLNDANKSNKQLKQMQKNYQYNQQKRKNLLNEQLASRRASLSAMGLGASKSAIAAQQREAKEGYDELGYNNDNYKYEYKQKYDEKEKNLTSGLLNSIWDTTGKIIK